MKVRIKFSKHGSLRFIGHLDLMRYFQKAIRRAQIDIAYSAGYSPHQIMSFAQPLSVGLESDGEYFDIEVHSLESTEELKQKLNEVMADGMEIRAVKILEEKEQNAMASVAAAAYLVSFGDQVRLPEEWDKKLLAFMEQDTIPVIKKTKKGEREIDLKEGVYQLEIRDKQVYLMLDAGSGSNLKPGFVLDTFFESIGAELPFYPYRITRLDTYKRGSDGRLVPLISE